MDNIAFALRVQPLTNMRPIMIYAFDDLVPSWDGAGRVRLTVEVRHEGKTIFPKGQLTCALHGSSDGIKARELVMSLVAMAPHDGSGVGLDYFHDYTLAQAAWANEWYEILSCEREARYCDDNGNVRHEEG